MQLAYGAGVRAVGGGLASAPRHKPVERQTARPEDEDEERRKPVSVRRGSVEIVGLGEDVEEVDAIVGDAEIGHGHVREEHQRDEARPEAEKE